MLRLCDRNFDISGLHNLVLCHGPLCRYEIGGSFPFPVNLAVVQCPEEPGGRVIKISRCPFHAYCSEVTGCIFGVDCV